jgi:uncharacterized protein CbrC (UPF0167 family)
MSDFDFKYHRGPLAEMCDLEPAPQACDLCGERRPCFRLGGATLTTPRTGPKLSVGCVACLKSGRFYFGHDTEAGLTDGARLRREYDRHRRVAIPPQAVIELGRTPGYPTWQQSPWLVHCDDFMAYLGEWKPADFHRSAPEGDGRALFIAMTDGDNAREFWDGATAGSDGLANDAPESWAVTYYAFRCLHCDVLRGNYDYP